MMAVWPSQDGDIKVNKKINQIFPVIDRNQQQLWLLLTLEARISYFIFST